MAVSLFSLILLSPLAFAIPQFKGTDLNGVTRSEKDLIGQPTIVIITPTRGAASESKDWAQSLSKKLSPEIHLRDILAIQLPFFISEEVALEKAQKMIPRKQYN